MSERRLIVPVSLSLLPGALATVERALHDTHYLGGALDALRIFGGTSGAGRLHFVVVEREARRTGAARALVDTAIAQLVASGARFVLAETPDDRGALPGADEFLRALEFSEESRVDDFFRDGVALSFMRRELASS